MYRFIYLFVLLSAVGATSAVAQQNRLTNVESQYIRALREEDFQKAAFYVDEGLVDPLNLSTGLSLAAYFYPDPECRGPSGGGYCTPVGPIAEHLVSLGIDLNMPLYDGLRPISFVCWGGSVAFNNTKILIAQKVEVAFFDDRGMSPLHYCAAQPAPSKLPISHRLDTEAWDRHKFVMEALISAGADINTIYAGQRPLSVSGVGLEFAPGATPLIMSVATWDQGHPRFERIEFLLTKGANPILADANGNTAVNYLEYIDSEAGQENTLVVLKMLAEKGADVMRPNNRGKSLYDIAVEKGDIDFALKIKSIVQAR
ncbi:MAG: hypothetical protein KF899_10530 [Parvibaculum sp.]|nr:hypothetical protein [Parvibaculum sp.]